MAYKIANLAADQARLIEELEKDLDVCAVALEPGLEMAQLNEEELEKVRALEQKLNVRLVVYKEC